MGFGILNSSIHSSDCVAGWKLVKDILMVVSLRARYFDSTFVPEPRNSIWDCFDMDERGWLFKRIQKWLRENSARAFQLGAILNVANNNLPIFGILLLGRH